GPHTLAVTIKDRAGHSASATSSFQVDTQGPFVRVIQPLPGSVLKTVTPHVLVEYGDADGVDLATFRLLVNGTDRTALCVKAAHPANGALSEATALPQGPSTTTAQIKDLTGNQGSASSPFSVDTIAPSGSLELPPAITNQAQPVVRVRYTDAGSGINTASVR